MAKFLYGEAGWRFGLNEEHRIRVREHIVTRLKIYGIQASEDWFRDKARHFESHIYAHAESRTGYWKRISHGLSIAKRTAYEQAAQILQWRQQRLQYQALAQRKVSDTSAVYAVDAMFSKTPDNSRVQSRSMSPVVSSNGRRSRNTPSHNEAMTGEHVRPRPSTLVDEAQGSSPGAARPPGFLSALENDAAQERIRQAMGEMAASMRGGTPGTGVSSSAGVEQSNGNPAVGTQEAVADGRWRLVGNLEARKKVYKSVLWYLARIFPSVPQKAIVDKARELVLEISNAANSQADFIKRLGEKLRKLKRDAIAESLRTSKNVDIVASGNCKTGRHRSVHQDAVYKQSRHRAVQSPLVPTVNPKNNRTALQENVGVRTQEEGGHEATVRNSEVQAAVRAEQHHREVTVGQNMQPTVKIEDELAEVREALDAENCYEKAEGLQHTIAEGSDGIAFSAAFAGTKRRLRENHVKAENRIEGKKNKKIAFQSQSEHILRVKRRKKDADLQLLKKALEEECLSVMERTPLISILISEEFGQAVVICQLMREGIRFPKLRIKVRSGFPRQARGTLGIDSPSPGWAAVLEEIQARFMPCLAKVRNVAGIVDAWVREANGVFDSLPVAQQNAMKAA